jgi:hypothetical protein
LVIGDALPQPLVRQKFFLSCLCEFSVAIISQSIEKEKKNIKIKND